MGMRLQACKTLTWHVRWSSESKSGPPFVAEEIQLTRLSARSSLCYSFQSALVLHASP